ncbi:threonine--tRNA ligase [Candidatus Poriferisocius sp.]|uniref:threonine--tRNA ligase n=1 Tax=Candidatus Poriferisocius sp. TaxID=3101276 RepID=UPI003B02D035
MADISVTLPDGSTRKVPSGATAGNLAAAIGPGLAKSALIATVDGVEVDLNVPLADGQKVSILTAGSEAGLNTLRHSTAHVLAQAVLGMYPGATYAIGPPIQDGFYYDFYLPGGATISDDDLEAIEARMRDIIAADQPFERHQVSVDEGLELFANHPYKREIIETVAAATGSTGAEPGADDLVTEVAGDGSISYYRNSESFVDLCRGPHVPSTGRLGHFKLMSVAGAYWRRDTGRPSLQRIYGTAWASRKDLAAHLHRLAEAEKRDHRRLARELDLLSWPHELGPGLAVWHPKGAAVRRIIEDYSRRRHDEGGYQFVFSPHIARSELWETSGHLDFYRESMYPPMEMDGTSYHPKPMNCPFHVLIYKSGQRSYRDLPIRMFELGTVYRYELSGAVHGLMRSRGFTQDDSHIFTTREQAPQEITSLVAFVLSVLRAFGFEDFEARLATRPPEKSVGDDAEWELATTALRDALEAAGLDYELDEGGGAFYGPKIDMDVRDAIGRSWQLSTIQVDFQLPERFDLEYVGTDGGRHRPVMIHRALMGSIERFFGVLIEHYGGAFPAWLAPVQVEILPVAAAHAAHAAEVADRLIRDGFRVRVSNAQEPLGRRIRTAKLQKVPYILVVGDDDVAHGTVGVNARGSDGEKRDIRVEDFASLLDNDVRTRR